MDKIKLVIWDLDETFWKGTISEEGVKIPKRHIGIVKELTARGIVNSICSKNDEKNVNLALEKAGIKDYFVFNSVNWEAKGQRLKGMIDEMNLRPVNVLFLDDNPSNLKEAEFYAKGIHARLPDFISGMLDHPSLKGKDDHEHSRLKQYKLLEQKRTEAKTYSSNEEFLRQSAIRIVFEDPSSHLERLAELSERTNQLNYTKKRSGEKDFKRYIESEEYEVKCFRVLDNYGDYGIAGTYIIKGDEYVEFIFSCRILGMGVPGFIYSFTGKKKLQAEGEVSEEYDREVDWITIKEGGTGEDEELGERKKLLIIGSCDLEQASYYMSRTHDIDKEFNYPKMNVMVHGDHTYWLAKQDLKQRYLKNKAIMRMPFMDRSIFETKMFSKDYDTIVYSPSMDYIQGLYAHKRDKRLIIPYGFFWKNMTEKKNWKEYQDEKRLTRKFLKWFSDNFTFLGPNTSGQFRKNLEAICSDKKKRYILLNQPEFSMKEERRRHHKKLNKVLDDFSKANGNVTLIDVREIVKGEKDVTDDPTHYTREAYYLLVQMLVKAAGKEITTNKRIWSWNRWVARAKKLVRMLRR
ncbi:HAD-IIIC family phosphatase [Candidatus Woesearchaeota archaeon]|nr:HAD-IIIC family phosphatase [Candidatus Woesearchaeota archaeon]